jgi:hypothetical protein
MAWDRFLTTNHHWHADGRRRVSTTYRWCFGRPSSAELAIISQNCTARVEMYAGGNADMIELISRATLLESWHAFKMLSITDSDALYATHCRIQSRAGTNKLTYL